MFLCLRAGSDRPDANSRITDRRRLKATSVTRKRQTGLPDTWFRPGEPLIIPDEFLSRRYVSVPVEHQFLPPEIAAADWQWRDRGRIWKMYPEGSRRRSTRCRFLPEEIVEPLKTATPLATPSWLGDCHVERQWNSPPSNCGACRRQSPDRAGRTNANIKRATQLHALRTLEGLGELRDLDLSRALMFDGPAHSPAELARHAVQIAAGRLAGSTNLTEAVCRLAEFPDARVRFEVAVALGEVSSDEATTALIRTRRRDGAIRQSRPRFSRRFAIDRRQFPPPAGGRHKCGRES